MKTLRLTTLLVALALAGCGGQGSAVSAEVTPVQTTWCEQWQHLGDEPGQSAMSDNQRFMFHLGFFLSRSAQVKQQMKEQTGMDDLTLNAVQQCYEENTPQLVDALDQACKTQVSDKAVKDLINGYFNWCIEQNKKSA